MRAQVRNKTRVRRTADSDIRNLRVVVPRHAGDGAVVVHSRRRELHEPQRTGGIEL